MAKSIRFAVLLALIALSLNAAVVINEVMYDPVGDDTGNEWLELYNNGTSDAELEGCRIQVGGAVFSDVFVFPHYILRAGRYLLIGEYKIQQAVYVAELEMQNGGDATDGVRFISADESYTDTVLYDSPNVNNLPLEGAIAQDNFAPDVVAGNSLARKVNGLDTDNCAEDFKSESHPSPGYPNPAEVDYALENCSLITDDYTYTFQADIINNSIGDSGNQEITLQITLNSSVLYSSPIEPLPPGTSQAFSTALALNEYSVGLLRAELMIPNDVNPDDNIWSMTLGTLEQTGICLNEVLYNPATDNQEWIELYIPPQVCFQQNLTISDSAGNETDFTLPSLCAQYLVLCENAELMQYRYPECPAAAILETNAIPALNNDGDKLYLKDENGIVIDSMAYLGNNQKKDFSLERYIEADSSITWHYSYDLHKGTPGEENSTPPPPSELPAGSIKLVGSPFNPLQDESMKLQYNFTDEVNYLSCSVYDLKGIKKRTLVAGLETGSAGELVWNGKDSNGKALERGIYILLTEVKNSSGNYFLRKQLTVVLATK